MAKRRKPIGPQLFPEEPKPRPAFSESTLIVLQAKPDALKLARDIAAEMCVYYGETDSAAVRQVLIDRHGVALTQKPDDPSAGFIFDDRFADTGRTRRVETPEGVFDVRIYRLKKGGLR